MIEVSVSTAPCAQPKILLGRQCENDAVNIVFDLSFLIDTFGEGTATLVHQRSKDSAPYIVAATQDGTELTWSVSNTDNAYVGVGRAELRWTVGDLLAKTIIYSTWVIKSITAGTTIPDVYQSWYDNMIEYIDQLRIYSDARLVQAVQDAEDAADDAEQAETNASASETAAALSAQAAAGSASTATTQAGYASNSASAAAASAQAAEQAAATSGYMRFYIDENGDLILQRTDNVDVEFYLYDGSLYVRD